MRRLFERGAHLREPLPIAVQNRLDKFEIRQQNLNLFLTRRRPRRRRRRCLSSLKCGGRQF